MTPKIDIIYLDMDGVLSDFMGRFRELNGDWKRDGEGKHSTGWHDFCTGGHFATLNPWPGGSVLYAWLQKQQPYRRFELEILTSTGGSTYHDQVAADKTRWCRDRDINIKVNAVPGRWTKKDWAHPSAILIDDTEDVIAGWTAAGGIGILHKDLETTINQLKDLLDIAY